MKSLAEIVPELRRAVARADYTLSAEAYSALADLFLAALAEPEALPSLAPEYARPELLLNVDAGGAPAPFPAEAPTGYRALLAAHPSFGEWLVPNTGTGVLLPRWLCHLSGLRHRTVQLYIDHPALAGHTLVQVRSFSKVQYPGCFDLPVAGHVVGPDAPAAALGKELAEELGLASDDIEGLQCLGAHANGAPEARGNICDCELSILYRCRLRPGGLARIHFADGEAAAICVFSLPELERMLTQCPERVASGLHHSFAAYCRGKRL